MATKRKQREQITIGDMEKLLADMRKRGLTSNTPIRVYSGNYAPHDLVLLGVGHVIGDGYLYDDKHPLAVPPKKMMPYKGCDLKRKRAKVSPIVLLADATFYSEGQSNISEGKADED